MDGNIFNISILSIKFNIKPKFSMILKIFLHTYMYQVGPFTTFIFYFVLTRENNLRNEEKKILAKRP